MHHSLVKESLDFMREIWSHNPDKNAYDSLFNEVMGTLEKAIYHQGYLEADFPLSFEDDLESRKIPNYLIVNELKE